jgi:hypothetical protein
MWLAVLILSGILSHVVKKGHWRTGIVLGECVLAVILLAGCGGSGGAGPGPVMNPGTPAGTYNLTVAGSSTSGSATLTHSLTLQLAVK